MKIQPDQITAALLREECGHSAYERGNGYYQEGRTELELVEEQGEFLHLLATTRGSGGRRYQQEIFIGNIDGSLDIDGGCSCPMGFNCKHVVAACLVLKHRLGAEAGPRSAVAAFSQWLAALSGTSADGAVEDERSKDYLLYHLSQHRGSDGIRVEYKVARLLKDGTFGKARNAHFSSYGIRYQAPAYMRPLDHEIVALLEASSRDAWSGTALTGAAGRTALDLMLKTGRVFWGAQHDRPLLPGPDLSLSPVWREEGQNVRLALDLPEGVFPMPVSPPLYIDVQTMRVGAPLLPEGLHPQMLDALVQAPPVPRSEAARVSRLLALTQPALPTPTEVVVREIAGTAPRPRITMTGEFPRDVAVLLDFLYDGMAVEAQVEAPVLTLERGEELLRIHRELGAEEAAAAHLETVGLERAAAGSPRFLLSAGAEEGAGEQPQRWFEFVEQVLPALEREDWAIEWPGGEAPRFNHATGVDAQVDDSDNDWFGLRFDIEVDGKRMPLLPLVSELIGDYRPGNLPPRLYLPDGAGNFIAIDSARVEPILQTIIDLHDHAGGDSLRLSRLDAPRLLDLGDIKVRGGNELQRLAKKLRNFGGIKAAKIPATANAALRASQQRGGNWRQLPSGSGRAQREARPSRHSASLSPSIQRPKP